MDDSKDDILAPSDMLSKMIDGTFDDFKPTDSLSQGIDGTIDGGWVAVFDKALGDDQGGFEKGTKRGDLERE